jgi:hypothetical protein
MSLLKVRSRPYALFDASDALHRRYYASFLINRSWKECPVQFHTEEGFGDVSSMIENKLTAYYLERELKKHIPTRSEHWYVHR